MKALKRLSLVFLVLLLATSCAKNDNEETTDTASSKTEEKSSESFVEKKKTDEEKEEEKEEEEDKDKKDKNKETDKKDKKDKKKDTDKKKDKSEDKEEEKVDSSDPSLSDEEYKLFKEVYFEIQNYDDMEKAYEEIAPKHGMTPEELEDFITEKGEAASRKLMDELEEDLRLKDSYAEDYSKEIIKTALPEIVSHENLGDYSEESLTVQLFSNDDIKNKAGEVFKFNYGVFGTVKLGGNNVDVDVIMGFKSLEDIKASKGSLLSYFSSSGVNENNIAE